MYYYDLYTFFLIIYLFFNSNIYEKYQYRYKWDGKRIECPECKENIKLINIKNRNASDFLMYVRKEHDTISDAIKKFGNWNDCKTMKELWYSLPSLNKEDYFMDAGANIGICSFDMLNEGIKVISIEPIPNNLHLFTKSLLYNSKWINNITLFKVGLSDFTGYKIINIEKNNWGGSSLINLQQNYLKKKINIVKLDSILNDFNHKIHIASVDIQGYELYMLKGSFNTLRRKIIRNFFMEIWCFAYRKINITEDEVYNLLEKYNYKIKDKKRCKSSTSFFEIIATLEE